MFLHQEYPAPDHLQQSKEEGADLQAKPDLLK